MTDNYPFFIVGSENCNRCQILYEKMPNVKVVKIPNKLLGLGDSFAYLTYLLGIDSCRSCKIRRSYLNKIFPFFWNAPKSIRDIRNKILSLGHESLPVLLDKNLNKIYNINDYVSNFNETYMND